MARIARRNSRKLRLLAILTAGAVLGSSAHPALAQQEGRRKRSSTQESKPIELAPDQITQLTKIAN